LPALQRLELRIAQDTNSQIVIKTRAITTAHHTIGTARFELPLRGESFGAWLRAGILSAFNAKPICWRMSR